MRISLLIDGNYILYKNVFNLHSSNILYGELYNTLLKDYNSFYNMVDFDSAFLVSDSRGSWRKKLLPSYKSKRKKSKDINWDFVYEEYDNVKKELSSKFKICEKDVVEGDDWIYYITNLNEKDNISNLIISNDFDLQQLIYGHTNPLFFNIMVNDNNRNPKMFVPENFKLLMHSMSHKQISLFDDSDKTTKIYRLLKDFINGKYTPTKISTEKQLVIKLLSGDVSDNIQGIYPRVGIKTAEKVYSQFKKLDKTYKPNDEIFEILSDLVAEVKKADEKEYHGILEAIKRNDSLINLKQIPNEILYKMKEEFNKTITT